MVPIGFKDSTGIPGPEDKYATNNQFLKSGPKGFIQVKILENDDLYVRVDLPGVPDDAVRHRVDAVRQKIVFFSGETVDDGNKVDPVREYSGSAGLGCDCCEITNVDAKMKDGILRMIIKRVKVKDHEKKCTLTLPAFKGKSGRFLEDHPFVVKGRKRALIGEPIANGGLYFSVDVPGVCAEEIDVLANENEARFRAEVKNVYEHDESARIYAGCLKSPHQGLSLLSHVMGWDAEYGVLKVVIAPPPTTTTAPPPTTTTVTNTNNED